MEGLLPIIRRMRRPLVSLEEPSKVAVPAADAEKANDTPPALPPFASKKADAPDSTPPIAKK